MERGSTALSRGAGEFSRGDAELSRGKSQHWLAFPPFELPRQVVYGLRALGFFLCLLGFMDFFFKVPNIILCCSWFRLKKVSRGWMILRLSIHTLARKGNGERRLNVLSY